MILITERLIETGESVTLPLRWYDSPYGKLWLFAGTLRVGSVRRESKTFVADGYWEFTHQTFHTSEAEARSALEKAVKNLEIRS